MAKGHQWIQVLQTHSQWRTKNIKGNLGVLLVLDAGKREDKSWKGEKKDSLFPASPSLMEPGVKTHQTEGRASSGKATKRK